VNRLPSYDLHQIGVVIEFMLQIVGGFRMSVERELQLTCSLPARGGFIPGLSRKKSGFLSLVLSSSEEVSAVQVMVLSIRR
jgi:hypothetical protein